jgi:hypothetical protein
VNPLADEFAERRVDHPLPLDPRPTGEERAFDQQREMALAGRIVAAVPAVLLAIVDQFNFRRLQRLETAKHFLCDRAGGECVHHAYIEGLMASRNPKLHGKVEGATGRCAVPGCKGRGEYRAPVQPANFDGPGAYRLLCLDHVREHNNKYNYFAGMSAEEISDAQSPLAGWERPSRRFAHNGADPMPAWADFPDPLEAIAASFRRADRGPPQRFTKEERRALGVLGLGDDAELHSVRRNYSKLVRRYHPDRNGGDRSHEAMLGKVIDAWQLLKKAKAFA